MHAFKKFQIFFSYLFQHTINFELMFFPVHRSLFRETIQRDNREAVQIVGRVDPAVAVRSDVGLACDCSLDS